MDRGGLWKSTVKYPPTVTGVVIWTQGRVRYCVAKNVDGAKVQVNELFLGTWMKMKNMGSRRG